jgi:hypothetical protein
MFRKYWLGILAIFLLAIALISAILSPTGMSTAISDLANKIEFVTTVLGWSLFIVQYLYNKSENFYVWVNLARVWATNETTKWNFTVDFYPSKRKDFLSKISKLISYNSPKSITWHKDVNSAIVNLPGYTLRIIETEVNNAAEERDYVIVIQISNLELPFRSFRRKIENEIIPVLNEISNIIKPTNQKYVAKISYSEANPFFGYFVRKLDLPKVVSFTCDILESGVSGSSQNVIVRKDKIEIVTDNLAALQSLSFKYIALSVN